MGTSNEHIFISYAREDLEEAQRLHRTLRRFGLPVWMDTVDLIPGQDWQTEIRKAIRNCSYFVVLLSKNSISKRGFVQRELKEALDVFLELPPGRVFLIPVRLDQCEPSDERIRRLHWVDFFPSWETGLQKLLSAVSSLRNEASVRKTQRSRKQRHKAHENRDFHQISPPLDQEQAHSTSMDAIREQLRLAGLVQRDFLPLTLPDTGDVCWAAAFLPADWVSGDIYDIARIDDRYVGFYVADAVGHSMPAALLTIFIKQSLSMSLTVQGMYHVLSPAEVVTNLNLKMARQKLSGYQFATCCYCLFDVKTRQLTFARAGHPYPILFRKGQPPQQLQTRGSLLGIFETAEFGEQIIQLERGDRLLLYSDGAESLIGRLDQKNGFQFADQFLALNAKSITEIIDQLTWMAKNRQLQPDEVDDLTLVGLQLP